MWTRRALLAASAAATGWPGLSFAAVGPDARLVLVLLRGGLDGLDAVVPYGDPRYTEVRGARALDRPGLGSGVLDLDGTFGLHPAFAPLMPMWAAGELAAVHAVATPYRERSHFDAQDILENGTPSAGGADTGWLNRALLTVAGPPSLAVGRNIPLVLRGPSAATSADLTRPPVPEDAWLDRVADLLHPDPQLARAFADALATQEMLTSAGPSATSRGLPARFRAAGSLLAADEGPRVAVIDTSGWDTHAQQEGALRRNLDDLAVGLVDLASAMGPTWKRTVVLVTSEFGRTASANGTGGTDHGTGGLLLLAGGAVSGGKVYGDWPGLGRLHDGRDVLPTTDVRSWFGGVLCAHLGVADRALGDIFPGDLRGVFTDVIRAA